MRVNNKCDSAIYGYIVDYLELLITFNWLF